MTNSEVFRAFIAGATSGKNPGGTLYIDSNALYSYGQHHRIALRMRDNGGRKFCVNRDRYSPTTSEQTTQFINAASATGCEIIFEEQE